MALSEIDKKKLVSGVCERNKATDLLENVFKNPKNPEFGEKLSNALNETILQEQYNTKDRSNLLLPMNRVRFIFASYINSCKNESHMSGAIQTLGQSGGSHSKTQAYEKVQSSAKEDQQHFRLEWESLIDDKGYPPSWKDMFTKHSKLQMESGPPSFDPVFMEGLRHKTLRELMKNIGLRHKTWGEISVEEACRKGVNSWNWLWVLESEGLFSKPGSGTGHEWT